MDPPLYRLLKVFRCGGVQRSLPVGGQEVFDADRMIELVQQIVKDAAAAGNCVIVGRGSTYFLRERTDTLRVFLFASRDFKLRFLQTHTKSEAKARELLDTVDHNRRAFVKHYFRVEWPYRPAYHAMLNSALGDDFILATMQNLMNELNQKEGST